MNLNIKTNEVSFREFSNSSDEEEELDSFSFFGPSSEKKSPFNVVNIVCLPKEVYITGESFVEIFFDIKKISAYQLPHFFSPDKLVKKTHYPFISRINIAKHIIKFGAAKGSKKRDYYSKVLSKKSDSNSEGSVDVEVFSCNSRNEEIVVGTAENGFQYSANVSANLVAISKNNIKLDDMCLYDSFEKELKKGKDIIDWEEAVTNSGDFKNAVVARKNQKDVFGHTLLTYFLTEIKFRKNFINFLVINGFEKSHKDNFGNTYLHWAYYYKRNSEIFSIFEMECSNVKNWINLTPEEFTKENLHKLMKQDEIIKKYEREKVKHTFTYVVENGSLIELSKFLDNKKSKLDFSKEDFDSIEGRVKIFTNPIHWCLVSMKKEKAVLLINHKRCKIFLCTEKFLSDIFQVINENNMAEIKKIALKRVKNIKRLPTFSFDNHKISRFIQSGSFPFESPVDDDLFVDKKENKKSIVQKWNKIPDSISGNDSSDDERNDSKRHRSDVEEKKYRRMEEELKLLKEKLQKSEKEIEIVKKKSEEKENSLNEMLERAKNELVNEHFNSEKMKNIHEAEKKNLFKINKTLIDSNIQFQKNERRLKSEVTLNKLKEDELYKSKLIIQRKTQELNLLIREKRTLKDEIKSNNDFKNFHIPLSSFNVGYNDGLIGKGEFGECYNTNLSVVSKIIKINAENSKENILNEIKLHLTVKSPLICRIFGYSVNSSKDEIIILMEKMKFNLNKMIKLNKDLVLSEKISIMIKITECVHVLHSKNILHRDLKCSNFLVDENGRIKLSDFGFATELNISSLYKRSKSQPSFLWMDQSLYIEDYDDRNKTVKFSKETDIYSLGCCFFEILYEKPPMEIMTNRFEKFVKIREKSVPKEVYNVIRMCIDDDIKKRPNTEKLILVLKNLKF